MVTRGYGRDIGIGWFMDLIRKISHSRMTTDSDNILWFSKKARRKHFESFHHKEMMNILGDKYAYPDVNIP
jgi:hypothetical protein